MKKYFLAVLSLWLLQGNALAVDPSREWKTLSTEHFRIHFDGSHQQADYEKIARRLAFIAERVHGDLSEWIQWQPDSPTHVVLSDESDAPNGYATPIPYNRTVLFLAPPRGVFSLEDYHDWLTMLFTHEYLHILHLDKRHDLPASVGNIFGRYFLLFPNAIQPRWFVEGLAVQHETDDASGVGRGQSSYFRMLMRGEVANGIKPVQQINQLVRSWPAGAAPYLYGAYFLQFLESEYGGAALKKWIDGYSDNLIPARVNSTAKLATGKTVPQLWQEFEVWLQREFADDNGVNVATAIEGEWLTDHGFQTSSLSAGGNVLYYVRDDHLLHPALMRLNEKGESEQLADLNSGAQIDTHAEQGVLIAQPEICHNYAVHYDLYRYREAEGIERLTECARYVDVAWLPAGNGILAAHVHAGESALHRLDSDAQLLEVLWQGEGNEVVGGIDISADGKHLAAAIWRQQVGWNIEEFDIESRRWTSVTSSPLIESAPHYDANGDLYFSAEYNGVYNIWRYVRKAAAFEQLTRVNGGAFDPVVSADGSLFYKGNHSGGFDIFRLESPAPLETLASLPAAGNMSPPATQVDDSASVENYAALPTLRPRWWLPRLILLEDATEIGFVTGGNDAVNRHAYAVTVAADVDNGYPLGGFIYSYSPTQRVNFVMAASSVNDVDRTGDDELERIRREDQFHLNAVFPFSGIERSWSVAVGISTDYESSQETGVGVQPFGPVRDNVAGIGLTYSDAISQPLSISRAEGRAVRVVAENSDVFDSDFSGNIYVLDWREFVRLGNSSNVLGLRYVRGHGTDFPRPFELGGVTSQSVVSLLNGVGGEPLLNRRVYELRGYDDDVPGLIGRRMQIASAEWRFPVALIERGLMSPPVGLNRISGRVFIENGAAWEGSSPDKTFSSAGFELLFDTSALYFDGIRIRFGFAGGFDDEHGEDELYLTIGGGF